MNGGGARAMAEIAILMLAAGAGRRMRGSDKLLEDVRGLPLLRDRALACIGSGIGPLLVTLPPEAAERRAALTGLALRIVEVPDAARGMGASLAAGAAAVPGTAAGVLVLPADMPDLTAADLRAVAAAYGGWRPVRGAAQDGTPGHPVLFPATSLPALAALSGDRGARDLAAGAEPVPLPARHALTDLDTPEDWAAWRAARAAPPRA